MKSLGANMKSKKKLQQFRRYKGNTTRRAEIARTRRGYNTAKSFRKRAQIALKHLDKYNKATSNIADF